VQTTAVNNIAVITVVIVILILINGVRLLDSVLGSTISSLLLWLF